MEALQHLCSIKYAIRREEKGTSCETAKTDVTSNLNLKFLSDGVWCPGSAISEFLIRYLLFSRPTFEALCVLLSLIDVPEIIACHSLVFSISYWKTTFNAWTKKPQHTVVGNNNVLKLYSYAQAPSIFVTCNKRLVKVCS